MSINKAPENPQNEKQKEFDKLKKNISSRQDLSEEDKNFFILIFSNRLEIINIDEMKNLNTFFQKAPTSKLLEVLKEEKKIYEILKINKGINELDNLFKEIQKISLLNTKSGINKAEKIEKDEAELLLNENIFTA